MKPRTRAALLILSAAALIGVPAGAASAATFTVVSTTDAPDSSPGNGVCQSVGAVPGQCTLRAAVQEANALAGNDTINLPAGDYQLTGAANEDDALTGDLDIRLPASGGAQTLTIVGAGARNTRILGTGSDRVFDVQSNTLTTSISNVTIAGGGGVGQGGGVFTTGILNLTNVTVSGNRVNDPAFISNQGGGIFNNDRMNLLNVTISGNVASRGGQSSFGPQGAGLFDNGSPASTLVNVTIAGNQLTGTGSQGGGLFYNAGAFSTTLRNVTVAGNSGPADVQGAGVYVNADLTFVNTIVALNRRTDGVASNCFGGGTVQSAGRNLEEGTDCNFTGAGDLRNSDPLLGPLQDNGGATDTRALSPGSPAIDAADGSACPPTDQRGIARPQLVGCDIGAFELTFLPDTTPPETTILSGPTGLVRGPVTFTFSANELGATFECSLDGGAFFSCSSFTTPGLRGGEHVFQVRARDAAGNVDPTPASWTFRVAMRLGDLPDPVLGTRVNVEPTGTGTVLWAPRAAGAGAGAKASQKGLRFMPLEEGRQIPVGSFVDTRRGSVGLQSARNRRGTRQRGDFASGIFQVLQSRNRRARGLTELRLKGSSFSRCRTGRRGGSARAAQLSGRTIRRLRSNANGNFRTRGRHSAATVRGTIWITSDRCDGTLTTVKRGRVAVRDLRRRRTVIVRAGKSYLAKAPQ